MKSKSLQRVLLLASGLCAVLVILLSQSFYNGSSLPVKKAEKAPDQKEVTIHAPSDVAVQGQSVALDHSQPLVAENLPLADDHHEKAAFVQKIATNFFKTLFRVIISPNAP